MIVYGSSISPYVRKVLAFAAEKRIEIEARPTGMGDVNPEFRLVSPFGKMPALSDGDYGLADSSAIIHYLEAKQPEPNLIPTQAKARGRAVWFDEYADTLLFGAIQPMFFNRVVLPRFLKRDGDLAAADAAERDALPLMLAYLEGQIPDSGFLVEDRLTLADLSVASPFANLRHLGIAIDPGIYPRTARYAAAILARPSFASLIERETAFLARTV